jgi:tetratricopeptide (TPR) repeat protein
VKRKIRAIGLMLLAAMPLLADPARADDRADDATLDRAVALSKTGDLAGGLALCETILAHNPNHENALLWAAELNFYMNNLDVARGRIERLVKVAGNYLVAWELMVQITQAQGDLERRDEAIKRLKLAISTALDPTIRLKSDFIRDRIPLANGAVQAVDYFARGGSDFTRYQFAYGDPRLDPEHGLLLRTDQDTTQNWSETALLPQEKQLFHLDMVDPTPSGGQKVAIYAYYVGEPDYDTVRAKVLEILRGTAQPVAGEPGSLQGIMKAAR